MASDYLPPEDLMHSGKFDEVPDVEDDEVPEYRRLVRWLIEGQWEEQRRQDQK